MPQHPSTPPNDPLETEQAIRSLVAESRYGEALRLLESVYDLALGDPSLSELAAWLLLVAGSPEHAIPFARAASLFDPGDQTTLLLAMALSRSKQYAEAGDLLAGIQSPIDDSIILQSNCLLASGQEGAALALIEARFLVSNSPEVGACLAYHLAQTGERSRAVRLLLRAIRTAPVHEYPYEVLSDLLAQERKWQTLLSVTERGIKAAGATSKLLLNKARALWALRRREEAIEALEGASRLAPADADIYGLMGHWRLRLFRIKGFFKAANKYADARLLKRSYRTRA